MKFSHLIPNVKLPPQLVRPHQAALILGSSEVLADFVAAGWMEPVMSVHRMVVYSYRHLEQCVTRLETGESPLPNDSCKRPTSHGMFEQIVSPPVSSRFFADQLRGMMSVPPLLLHPAQAETFLSSRALLDEMRKCDWIRPVYCQQRLTLFSVRHLETCVLRLEAGQKPGDYADENPTVPKRPVLVAAAPVPVTKPNVRVFRKTRRPMPPGLIAA